LVRQGHHPFGIKDIDLRKSCNDTVAEFICPTDSCRSRGSVRTVTWGFQFSWILLVLAGPANATLSADALYAAVSAALAQINAQL
jgi:hypothetical protein